MVAIFPGRTDKYFIKIFAIINNIRNNNNTYETNVVKLVDGMGSNLDGNRGRRYRAPCSELIKNIIQNNISVAY